ncbi:RDD family protein [Streptomyces europaeiscabiei]|uniref:RDD family protein n=1 Tax=Streptomyces europaeiscabiei TaxID=146819 RepID=UPI0029B52BA1|nr:RDD family protein [Streptomyces europaeiscabiei]MDX3634371.1 RDD family protein [Streptomyces europaeiscabiei]MDX3653473.1 RDD family protein [Streptomyces europaeiscabiei]
MSELVTGEAVALELRPAKLPSRALAVLLDLIVAMVVYLAVVLILVLSTAGLDEAAQTAISIASFLLVLVGGPIAVETLSHGRSLGKLACGLRVVRDDGGPIRFRHALVRGAVGVVEILMTFGVVACIASLVSARGRRLGDVFAGTLVVRERVPAGQTAFVPPPPPWLVGQFSRLDLSAVPDGLWLAIRQYLTRMRQLDPHVGAAMAERLASDLAARTGAPAPYGVPPGAYLAAVVHERQARDARQAFGGAAGVGGVPNAAGAVAGGAAVGGVVPGAPAGGPGWGGPVAQPPVAPVYGPPGAYADPAPPSGAPGYVSPGGVAGAGHGAGVPGVAVHGVPVVPQSPHEPPAERPSTGFAPPA